MRHAVGQRQADEGPARRGIGVGRPVTLEMVEHQEPVAAGRKGGGFRVQGREVEGRAAEPAQPVDDGAGGGLPAFEHVATGERQVGIGPPEPRLAHRTIGHDAELQVRRAGDEGELPGSGHAEPDHADHRIDSALDHAGARG